MGIIITCLYPHKAIQQGLEPSKFDSIMGGFILPATPVFDPIKAYVEVLLADTYHEPYQLNNGLKLAYKASQRGINWRLITRIAFCESSFDDKAHNTKNKDGSNDYGILQSNSKYHPQYKNIDQQIEYGLDLFESQGTSPWNSSKPCWDTK